MLSDYSKFSKLFFSNCIPWTKRYISEIIWWEVRRSILNLYIEIAHVYHYHAGSVISVLRGYSTLVNTTGIIHPGGSTYSSPR